MTAAFDEEALRNWLVDYLLTNIGCSIEDIDVDASMNDLGVGSRDAVVLSGELSELLGRTISPVEFWAHPSISALARFLVGAETIPAAEPEFDAAQGASGHGASSHYAVDEPIAVIGMGCRFPGDIAGPEAFWQFLHEGGSAVQEVPAQRWAPFEDGSPETAAAIAGTTHWGSFLSDIDAFDAEFFEISTREAVKMDPQQRLLLEVAWEALENAGIPPSSLRHTQTGVFVGASITEYGCHASADLPSVDAWSNAGGALSIIANRLSYFLDLRGPSLTVDTACSSSLVALHLACQSLRMQDCGVAIAAGVNLLMSPAVFRGFDQSGALSPTGACHSFDADADGFVRGEGCGAVVLKRLSDAVRDGDPVLAVVRGSAVNQDGRSNGLLAPNPAAQMAVLRTAYANAGLSAHDVDYVETHGTGTLLGDPIEARALGTVLGRGRPQTSPLLLGAVKSNLGHLEAAAGMAGFIKSVLAIQRGTIPKNLHFETPNPHIAFDQLRLKVVAEQQDWPQTDRPRRAGVSSFGFGGTNAHVVIEQAPAAKPVTAEAAPVHPSVTTMVISGSTPDRIASTAAALADWMVGAGSDIALPDVAHTLNHHRNRYASFATVTSRDRAGAVAGLQALGSGRTAPNVSVPHDSSCRPGTVFLYSGQGSHWSGMGRQLFADEPVFAAAIAEIEPAFVENVGFSLQKVIAEGLPVSGDAQVQPVLMGLQLALTELWRSYGVHPDAVIGHSMGEVTAAVVAGALTVSEGLRVIAIRSRLMSQLAGQGAVALLGLDVDAAEALIADFPGVSVAGFVSPGQQVVAGPIESVDAVIAAASAQNRFARRVNMEVASHTAMMEPILPELRSALADLAPQAVTIPFYSTVTAGVTDPVLDAEYWVANVRQPALLSQAIVAAAEQHGTFIEVSAHPILTHAVNDSLESVTHHHSLGTLSRDGDDTETFHINLNAAHTSRPRQLAHPPEPHPVLPTTPWHHSKFWIPATPARRPVNKPADFHTPGFPPEWLCELAWPAEELAHSGIDPEATWLAIADATLGAAMSRRLGASVAVLDPATATTDHAALADALAGATHVLYAPPAASDDLDLEAAYDQFNAARRVSTAIAALALPPRLFLLTRNAQPVFDGDRSNPAHAVLWGLGRTLALEHPEIWGGMVDVDASVSAGLAAGYVLAEACGGDGEDQVLYRAGVRRVPRLRAAQPPSASPVGLDHNGSHVVIGATGNIGPQLIQQLADMGAGTIVAVSRNPGTRLDDLATRLADHGTKLVIVAGDASDATAMGAVFERFGADLPPLHGIYLAAFGGGPVTVRDMADADVSAMFTPKLDALTVLHQLSLDHPVRQFVVFSSISGLTGSRWLAHYAATTTYLDTFAFARRAAGLPANTINWGLWKSLSDSQSEQERQVTLESGLMPMPDDVAIDALSVVIGPNTPVRSVVVAADWPRLAAAYRTRAALRILDDVVVGTAQADAQSSSSTAFRIALREADPAKRHDMLVEHVRAAVASAMGLASPQLVDVSEGFFQSGMDSLMSVTLQRGLAESLGEALSASLVFDYPSVDALTGYLESILPELVEVAESESVDEYDDLTDDELLAQLSERLS